jgi:pyruvate dehydrogenase E2 component (dihydrolipoamide acetyltransferase)
MSKFDFKLPDIGEGVMEGEIVKWLVAVGEAVTEDQPMVEVMTDKATVTITSPKTGKILELGGAEGAVIPVHTTLVVLDLANGHLPSSAPEPAPAARSGGGRAASSKPEPAATAVGDIKESLPGMALLERQTSATPVINERPLATPATRKLARELGVDLTAVAPTGPHGRVMKDDVQRAAGHGGKQSASAPLAVRAPVDQQARELRTPLRGVRKRIFDGMARSKHTAAHFTFVEECDVSALKALRDRLKVAAAEQGVKLTYLPLFVKAVVAALKRHPKLNSAYDEATGEIVERRYYNIGIASATDAGLMVPVIKDADRLGLLDIAREIERLSEATKTGRVSPSDLSGSTFTITSLGRQGGLFATPILNMPEVGILGIHRIKERPVVRDGQIVIGDVMLLSLSFDHRLIDGHVGAAFAYEIIRYFETPELLLLEA